MPKNDPPAVPDAARASATRGSADAAGRRRHAVEPASLAARLRAATQAAHQRLDHHPALAPLIRPDLRRDHYGRVLGAFAWVYRTLDPAFEDALRRLCPDTTYRSSDRSRWLVEDLSHFEHGDRALPPWPAPKIDTVAALVGRLYAIEGSTLGGQVIARQLQASLGVGPSSGARIFHGHGEATAARWQEFQDFAAWACAADDAAKACAAADAMFGELEQLLDLWFEPSGSSLPHPPVPSPLALA